MKSDDPLIPGSNVIGSGFDITGKYDISSVKPQVVSPGDATNGNTFVMKRNPDNPSSVDIEYTVPDNVSPIPDIESDAKAYVATSKTDFQSQFAASMSVDVSAGSFSGEFDYAYSSSSERSGSTYYAWVNAYTKKYSLSLISEDRTSLSDSFAADVAALPKTYTDDSQAAYMDFIRRYGTHFVSGLTVGGSMRYYLAVDESFSSDQSEVSANVSLEYKAVFVDSTANASTDWQTLTQNWASSRTTTVYTCGGSTDMISGLVPGWGDNDGQAYGNWLASLDSTPGVMAFTLTPLNVAVADAVGDQIKQALDDYLNCAIAVSGSVLTHNGDSPSETAFGITVQGVAILPDPPTPTPAPVITPQDNYTAVGGVQIALIDGDSLDPLFSKVYFYQLFSSFDDFFGAIEADIANFPKSSYYAAVTWFNNSSIPSFPSPKILAWLNSCGALLADWRERASGSADIGLMTYLMIGTSGAQAGTAKEATFYKANQLQSLSGYLDLMLYQIR